LFSGEGKIVQKVQRLMLALKRAEIKPIVVGGLYLSGEFMWVDSKKCQRHPIEARAACPCFVLVPLKTLFSKQFCSALFRVLNWYILST
jgi:hypothetical protein